MSDYLEAFKQMLPYLTIGAKVFGVLGFLALTLLGIKTVQAVPVSIRVQSGDQEIEYAGFLKTVVCAFIILLTGSQIAIICTLPLLVAAKIGLIEFLAGSIVACWVGILNSGRWAQQLVSLQAECDLATNLTFLQGEMVRSQLEDVNERLRKQLEPQELDATETLLKTMSPLMMLFVQKEKSIMKWSMAAVNAGKTLTKYFNSPKK